MTKNPIYAIGTKLDASGMPEIVAKGLPGEVRDALAALIYKEAPLSSLYIGIKPPFDLESEAAQELASITDPHQIQVMLLTGQTEFTYNDGSKLSLRDGKPTNPERKDPAVIPEGVYCYDQNGGCPYYKPKSFGGVEVPFCSYLGLGGTEGSLKQGQTEADAEADHQKLLAHFGSEEAMDEALPLMLLFDSCKECGINDREE